MKSTGIVRCIDPQGRVVLPKELRITLNIDLDDSLEIYTEDDSILLKKYSPHCVLCGNLVELNKYKGKNVCKKCILELK